MASQTSTIDASVAVGGNVDRSAIVTGNHNDVVVVNNYHGVQMGKVGADARPSPKLRPTPVLRPTRRFKNPVGRKAEIERVKAALADQVSLCWHGEDGMGKTVLLKILEHDLELSDYPHGLFHFLVEDTAVDEVRASIFDAFYECDVPFKPNKSQFRHYMKDVCAVVVLDDVNLNAKEIEALYDDIEQCVLLIASEKPIHFSDAEIEVLQGLPQEEAISYLEQQLKRPLEANEKPLAAELCSLRQGQPMHLKLDASNIRGGEKTFEQIISAEKPSGEESTQKAAVDSGIDQSQREAARLLAALQGALTSPDLIASLTKNLGQKSSGASDETADQQDLLKHLSDIGLAHSGSGYRLRSDLQQEIQRTTDLTPYREQLLQHFLATANQYEDNQQRFLEDVGPLLGILHWAADQQKWSELLGLSMAIQGHLWNAKRWTTWGKVLELVLRASEALGDRYHVGWAKHQLGTLAAIRHDDLREPRQSVNAYRQFHLLNEARRIRESLGDPLALGITQNNLAIARKRWHRRIAFLCLLLLLPLFIGTAGMVISGILTPKPHFKIDPISIQPGERRELKLSLTPAGIQHAKDRGEKVVVFTIRLDQTSGLDAPQQIDVPIDKASKTFTLTAGSSTVYPRKWEMTVSCPDAQVCQVPIQIEPPVNVPPESLVLQDMTLDPSSVFAGDLATVRLLLNRAPSAVEKETKIKLSYEIKAPNASEKETREELKAALYTWPTECDWQTFNVKDASLSVSLKTPSIFENAEVQIKAHYADAPPVAVTLEIEPLLAVVGVTFDPSSVFGGDATEVKLLLNREPLANEKKQNIALSYTIENAQSFSENTRDALNKMLGQWPKQCDWNTLTAATGEDRSLSLSLIAPKTYEAAKVKLTAQFADSPSATKTLGIEPLLSVVDVAFDPSSVLGSNTAKVELLLNRAPLVTEKNQDIALSYTVENAQSLSENTRAALEKMRGQWPKECDWKTLSTATGGDPSLSLTLNVPNIYEAAQVKVTAQYADSPSVTKTLVIKPLLAVVDVAFNPASVLSGDTTQVKLLLSRAPLVTEKNQDMALSYTIENEQSLSENTRDALNKVLGQWPKKCNWNTLTAATGEDRSLSLSLKAPKTYETAKVKVTAQYADSKSVTKTLVIKPLLAVVDVAFNPASVLSGDTTQVKLLLSRAPLVTEKNQDIALSYTIENEQSLSENTRDALNKVLGQWPKKCNWNTLTAATGEDRSLSLSLKAPKTYETAKVKVTAQYADSKSVTKTLVIKPLLAIVDVAFDPASVLGGDATKVKLLLNREPLAVEKKQSIALSYTVENEQSLSENTRNALEKMRGQWPKKCNWNTPAVATGEDPSLRLSVNAPKIHEAAKVKVTAQYFDSPPVMKALAIKPLPTPLVLGELTLNPTSVLATKSTNVKLPFNRTPSAEELLKVSLKGTVVDRDSLSDETLAELDAFCKSLPTQIEWQPVATDTKEALPALSVRLMTPEIYQVAKLKVEARYEKQAASSAILVIEPVPLILNEFVLMPKRVSSGLSTNVELWFSRAPSAAEKRDIKLSSAIKDPASLNKATVDALKAALKDWTSKNDWQTTSDPRKVSVVFKTPKIYQSAELQVAAQYFQSGLPEQMLTINKLDARVTNLAIKDAVTKESNSITGGHDIDVEIDYEGDKVKDVAPIEYEISNVAVKFYLESLKWLKFLDDGIVLRDDELGNSVFRKARSSLRRPSALHNDANFALTAKIADGELKLIITERKVDAAGQKSGGNSVQGTYTRYFTIRSPRPKSLVLNNAQAKKLIGGSTIGGTISLDGPAPGAYGENTSFKVELYLVPMEELSSPKPDSSSGARIPGDGETFVAFLDDSNLTKEQADSSPQPAKVLEFKSQEDKKNFDLALPPVSVPTKYKFFLKRDGKTYLEQFITLFPPAIDAIVLSTPEPIQGGQIIRGNVKLNGLVASEPIQIKLRYILPIELEERNLGPLREAKKNWPNSVEVAPGENLSKQFDLPTVPFSEQVLVKIKIEASYSYLGCPDKDQPYTKYEQELTLHPLPVTRPATVKCAAPQPCRAKFRVFGRRTRR